MATRRDNKQNLQLASFSGGLNEFDGLIQNNQVSAIENMEFFNGELRTRNGQKLIAHTSQFGRGMLDVNGALVDTDAGTLMNNVTTYYLSGGFFADVDMPVVGWKTAAFIIDVTTPNNDTSAIPTIQYFSDTNLDYRTLIHEEYDLTGAVPVVDRTHLGSTKRLLIVNVPSDHNATENYKFFADWQKQDTEPTNQESFWLKIILPTIMSAGVQITKVRSLIPARPQAMTVLQTEDYGNTLLVARPRIGVKQITGTEPIVYGFQDNVRVPISDKSYEELPAALEYTPLELVTTSGLKLTRWAAETVGGDHGPNGLVVTPNEEYVLFPRTGRVVLSTHSGPTSLQAARGNDNEFAVTQQTDDNELVFTEFPLRTPEDIGPQFEGLPVIKDLGSPTAIGKYENALFLGYRNGVIRWGEPSPGEDVFPTEAFTVIQEDDPVITALVQWSSFLVVFTNDSIWVIEPNGQNTLSPSNIQDYIQRKLVNGVGTVSKNAIVEVEGALWFLARDGIYGFNGQGEPQKISQAIQRTFDQGLNLAALPYACAGYYKSKRQIWFSVASTGSYFNDTVIIFDRISGGIFIQKGINAEQITYDDVNGTLYTIDFLGRIWQQDYGDADGIDNALPITCSFTTPPLNGKSFNSVRLTDLLLYLRHYIGADYTATPIVDGKEGTAQTINLDYLQSLSPPNGETELAWGDTGFDLASVSLPIKSRRKKLIQFDVVDGTDVQVRIDLPDPAVGEKLSVFSLEMLAELIGKR